ncbi:DUF1364 family protein [Paracidovorax citrulli]|uniref:nuclease domain-containing protein n=1 Tax=Paracidovorax citrulli TaxID=80869 RepID=UPI003A810D9E
MRRTGFRRRERAAAPLNREARLEARAARAMAEVRPRASTMASASGPGPARPKTKAKRNAHLRDMARGMPCLLQIAGVCNHDRTTVVCCHSNLSCHGKAGARKADDHYSVWGCAACHRWLDQGTATGECKEAAFMAAHMRQVLEWRAIAFAPDSTPRDRSAAAWALEHLNATPRSAGG